MKTFQGRTAEPRDADNYFNWLKAASDINLVDTKVYEYPTTNTIVVDADNTPVLMNSVHLVLQMEALAPKPGLPPKDEALALRELLKCIHNLAKNTGIAEIFFTCADPNLETFLDTQEENNVKRNKRGFRKVKTAVYKYEVGDNAGDQKES